MSGSGTVRWRIDVDGSAGVHSVFCQYPGAFAIMVAIIVICHYSPALFAAVYIYRFITLPLHIHLALNCECETGCLTVFLSVVPRVVFSSLFRCVITSL